MELELKHIQERPLILYIFIAIAIHIAIGFVAFQQLQTPAGQNFIAGEVKTNPVVVEPETPSNPAIIPIDDTPSDDTDTNPETQENTDSGTAEDNSDDSSADTIFAIPPFEPSQLTSSQIHDNTFVHETSGFLFADEIAIPEDNKPQIEKRVIVPPNIHKEFTVRNLPRELRDREWNLTIRLKVNKDGDPVGRIRVIKSSSNKDLDNITIARVEKSRFEPAHYEGTSEYLDYTFDLDINYK